MIFNTQPLISKLISLLSKTVSVYACFLFDTRKTQENMFDKRFKTRVGIQPFSCLLTRCSSSASHKQPPAANIAVHWKFVLENMLIWREFYNQAANEKLTSEVQLTTISSTMGSSIAPRNISYSSPTSSELA